MSFDPGSEIGLLDLDAGTPSLAAPVIVTAPGSEIGLLDLDSGTPSLAALVIVTAPGKEIGLLSVDRGIPNLVKPVKVLASGKPLRLYWLPVFPGDDTVVIGVGKPYAATVTLRVQVKGVWYQVQKSVNIPKS